MRRFVRVLRYAATLAVLAGLCSFGGGSIVAPPVAASTSDPIFMMCNAGVYWTAQYPELVPFTDVEGCCDYAARFACGVDTACYIYDYNYCVMTHPNPHSGDDPPVEPPGDDDDDPEILP